MTVRPATLTWCAVLAAGTLTTIYFATVPLEPHSDAGLEAHVNAQDRLIPVPVQELSGLTIVRREGVRQLLRGADTRWTLHEPAHRHGDGAEHEHASTADFADRIDRAVTMLGETRIERTVSSGGLDERFGTAEPEMQIILFAEDETQPIRQILVGDVAPDSLGRYVFLQDRLSTAIIPNYQIANLTELLQALDETLP